MQDFIIQEFIIWGLTAGGVFFLWMALSMKTQNMLSSMFFKVFPFIFSMVNLFAAGKLSGMF